MVVAPMYHIQRSTFCHKFFVVTNIGCANMGVVSCRVMFVVA